MIEVVKYIHLVFLATWLGSMGFFTFIGAPAIFKTLERQLAGDVVGAIFPKYFLIGEISSVVAIVTLSIIGVKSGFSVSVKVGLVILALMTVTTYYSGLSILPNASEVKKEMRAETDEVKKAELTAKFRKIHGVSMALNVATIVLGLILLFYTVKYLSA